MKSIGGGVRRREDAEQGLGKKQNGETHTSFTLVGTG